MRVRVTSLLVLIGLVAQAAAYVCHSGVVLGKALNAREAVAAPAEAAPSELDALVRDVLASICHSTGDGSTTAILPGDAPAQDGSNTTCPICNGVAPAFLLATPGLDAAEIRFVSQLIEFAPFDERVASLRLVRPQSRGPPAKA